MHGVTQPQSAILGLIDAGLLGEGSEAGISLKGGVRRPNFGMVLGQKRNRAVRVNFLKALQAAAKGTCVTVQGKME